MLILLALLGVPLAWFANWQSTKLRQQRAAERIESRRGGVSYESSFRPPIAFALSYLLPKHCIREARVVGAYDTDDSLLKEVAHFPQLQYLTLSNSPITDEGLRSIRHLTRLRQLSLQGSNVTDRGVAQLSSLQELERLHLSGRGITDTSLRQIARCKQLQELVLIDTSITDEGVQHLNGAPQLHTLYIGGSQVTSRVFDTLETMPKLKQLDLGQSQIDDAAIPQICRLNGLEVLCLRGTRLSEEGKKKLRQKFPSWILHVDD